MNRDREPGAAREARIQDGVRKVASAMRRVDTTAEAVERICAQVPEIEACNAREVALQLSTANGAVAMDLLQRGVEGDFFQVSAEALHYTRRLAALGLPLPAITRAFYASFELWVERWGEAVKEVLPGDPDAIDVLQRGTLFVLSICEKAATAVSTELVNERERISHERAMARYTEVKQLLSDPDVDAATVSGRLGFRLGDYHHAFVLRRFRDGGDAGYDLEQAVRGLAEAFQVSNPLHVQVGGGTSWCWITSRSQASFEVPLPAEGVIIAQGRPYKGLEGFRRSHVEAVQAMRIGELRASRSPSIISYPDVAVEALCTSAGLEACREFVAVELGRLALDDPRTQRSRDFLKAYYAENSNFRATGARLGIHHNTVRNHLGQVEDLLGHPLNERRLAVELALHIQSILEGS